MAETVARRRIGIFGGTFDPIHFGHLLIAEHARLQLHLSQVRFVLAAQAPHKLGSEAAEAKHRWEMLRLAIGGNAHFVPDDRELRRGGTSYTVDTLQELKDELPDTELVFLMGADSLAELHTWREPQRICELAFVAVVSRGGRPLPDWEMLRPYLSPHEQQQADLSGHAVKMPQVDISSTEIRRRLAAGQSVRYQVPPAVEAYIAAQGLYTQA